MSCVLSHSLHMFQQLNVIFCRQPELAPYRQCDVYEDQYITKMTLSSCWCLQQRIFPSSLYRKWNFWVPSRWNLFLNSNIYSAYLLAPVTLQENKENASATHNNDQRKTLETLSISCAYLSLVSKRSLSISASGTRLHHPDVC
jgi:hypothetical protein